MYQARAYSFSAPPAPPPLNSEGKNKPEWDRLLVGVVYFVLFFAQLFRGVSWKRAKKTVLFIFALGLLAAIKTLYKRNEKLSLLKDSSQYNCTRSCKLI